MILIRAAVCALAALALAACGQQQATAPASPAAPAPEAAAPAEPSQVTYASSEALIILGSNYGVRRLGWDQLDNVPLNGRQMREALEAQGFTQITILEDPTSAQMRTAVTEFFRRQRSEADLTRAVLYFAGHGDTSLDPQAQRQMGYLIPIDAPSQDRDLAGFHQLALPMSFIRDEALASTARHTMLVLDACFSTSIYTTRSGARRRSFQAIEEMSRRSVFVLSASDVETADAGPFTRAFTEAIAGGADFSSPRMPADGIITATEIGSFVKNYVLDLPDVGNPGYSQLAGLGDVMFLPPADSGARALGDVPEGVTRALEVQEIFERETPQGEWVPVDVVYYRKDGDGTRVSDALARARIPFQTPAVALRVPESARATSTVNAIACSPDAPGQAVRFVALALHDAGIPVRAVVTAGRDRASNLIQVYTSAQRAANRPLSRAQLEAIESCPASLQNTNQPNPVAP